MVNSTIMQKFHCTVYYDIVGNNGTSTCIKWLTKFEVSEVLVLSLICQYRVIQGSEMVLLINIFMTFNREIGMKPL